MQKTKRLRRPAVQGSFYPADRLELRAEIASYLREIKNPLPPPKAMIAPHAGTIYSGPIAATAYATLKPVRDQIRRVVLLGPSHRVPFRGIAASTATHFETPLGEIPLETDFPSLPQVLFLDEAHREEHSLELHLPFLQETLEKFSLLPLVVGFSEPQEVGELLEAFWGGDETLVVVSSDLSHYLPYERAKEVDRKTTELIERLDWKDWENENACGFYPVRGLLFEAARRKMKVKTADLRNSGDTAGSKDRVVGYGSYLFYS